MASELDLIVAKCQTILAQCLVAANEAAEAAATIGNAGLAPLNSPAFTGMPTAPTAAIGTATTQLATTAFMAQLLGQPSGIATLDSTGVVPLGQLPFAGLTYDGTWNAATNTPTLISGSGVNGHFRVVTVSGSTNLDGITSWAAGDWALFSAAWTKVPYVAPPISNLPLTSIEGIAPSTFVGNTGGGTASPSAISIASILGYLADMVGDAGGGGTHGLVPAPPPGSTGSGAFLKANGVWAVPPNPDLTAYATLNSPSFTGTATVVTQARDLSSTAIASTQFVLGQLAGADELSLVKVNGTTSAGTSTHGARVDHIHGTDTSRASASNPTTSGPWTHSGSAAVSGTLTAAVLAATVLFSALNGTVTGNLLIGGTLTGAVVKEANLAFVDGTVGDATIAKHGLLPKLSNVSTQFLNGTGGFTSPPVVGGSGGIVVSGTNVVLDTNNVLGIGAVTCITIGSSAAAVASGATFTGNSGLAIPTKFAQINSGSFQTGTTAVPTGQVWRNIMAYTVGLSEIGFFIRVS